MCLIGSMLDVNNILVFMSLKGVHIKCFLLVRLMPFVKEIQGPVNGKWPIRFALEGRLMPISR